MEFVPQIMLWSYLVVACIQFWFTDNIKIIQHSLNNSTRYGDVDHATLLPWTYCRALHILQSASVQNSSRKLIIITITILCTVLVNNWIAMCEIINTRLIIVQYGVFSPLPFTSDEPCADETPDRTRWIDIAWMLPTYVMVVTVEGTISPHKFIYPYYDTSQKWWWQYGR